MTSIFQKCVNQMMAIRKCLGFESIKKKVDNPLMRGILDGLKQRMSFKCRAMMADIQTLWQCTEVIHNFLDLTLTKSDSDRQMMSLMSQNRMCDLLMG